MNNMGLIVALIIVAVILAVFIFLYIKSRSAQAVNQAGMLGQQQSEAFSLLMQQMNDLRNTVDGKLKEVGDKFDSKSNSMQQTMNQQTQQSFNLIKDVTERLTKLDETNKQVVSFTDQLQSLQDILKNPKQRGILGEYYLETLLKNVLPTGSYVMQYPFKDGTIVDAVVKVKDKIIPIDSKFSLENYNRLVEERDPLEKERLEKAFRNDLKLRIDETSKYIKPSEDTMEFAFMFIPHEAIYYDLLVAQVGSVKVNTRDLIEYAFKEKHVIIVSPTSFLAYLQTVLQGLKALQIEESAKEIRTRVEQLGKHIAAFDQYMGSLGDSINKTVNQYNKAHKELKKVDKDIMKISGTDAVVEVMEIAGPEFKDEE